MDTHCPPTLKFIGDSKKAVRNLKEKISKMFDIKRMMMKVLRTL